MKLIKKYKSPIYKIISSHNHLPLSNNFNFNQNLDKNIGGIKSIQYNLYKIQNYSTIKGN